MRTSNPALPDNLFANFGYAHTADSMTMQGVVMKTGILLLLVLLSAAWTWHHFFLSGGNVAAVSNWLLIGAIGGFVVALITVFKPIWANITAPIYAVLEGLFMGGVSALMEQSFPGIVMQAILLTAGTLFAMLALYRSGWIAVTDNFKLGIAAATGGIAIAYLISFVLSFFNIQVPLIYGNGMVGIGFSIFVVIIAALNLILDFDFIEKGARSGAPKYMEWYGSFALMVTLLWLYIEILRLLSKIRSRD
jgi:uncharacterized YccA/Bax inhibitor family protein